MYITYYLERQVFTKIVRNKIKLTVSALIFNSFFCTALKIVLSYLNTSTAFVIKLAVAYKFEYKKYNSKVQKFKICK